MMWPMMNGHVQLTSVDETISKFEIQRQNGEPISVPTTAIRGTFNVECGALDFG